MRIVSKCIEAVRMSYIAFCGVDLYLYSVIVLVQVFYCIAETPTKFRPDEKSKTQI